MRQWLLLLTLTLLFTTLTASVNASEYTIVVERESVLVRIQMNFRQNLTSIEPSIVLPPVSGLFTSENSTGPAAAVASAIQSLVPKSRIEEFVMDVRSTPWSEELGTQTLNVTVSFRVFGVVEQRGDDFLTADLSWKSFKVTDGIFLGGVDINRIGELYIAEPAQRLADAQPPTTFGGVKFYWEGLLVPAHGVREVFSRPTILDFSRVGGSLSQWLRDVDVANASTVFAVSPSFRTVVAINTVFREDPNGEEIQSPHVLITEVKGEVRVEGLAVPRGDILTVDLGGGYQPTLMAVIIGSAITVLVSSSAVERRLTRQSLRRAKRSR